MSSIHVVTFAAPREVLFLCSRRRGRRRAIAPGRRSSCCTRRSRPLRTNFAIWTAKVPTTSGRPVDQNLLPGLDPPVVTHGLEGREPRRRHGCRFLERHLRRLPAPGEPRGQAAYSAQEPPDVPKTSSPGLKLGHLLADRLHPSCHVAADRQALRSAQTRCRTGRRTALEPGTTPPGSRRMRATFSSTWWSSMTGVSTSRSSTPSEPYVWWTIAFMLRLSGPRAACGRGDPRGTAGTKRGGGRSPHCGDAHRRLAAELVGPLVGDGEQVERVGEEHR